MSEILTARSTGRCANGELQQFGVVPWRPDRTGATQIMLITSRRRQRWIVPKGWPIKDQPPITAALREAFEEAGIIGDIHPSPLTGYRYLKMFDDGSVKPCRVTLFSMKVQGTLNAWREKGQRQRCWLSVSEAANRLDDVELGDFLRDHGPFPRGSDRLRGFIVEPCAQQLPDSDPAGE